MSPAREPLPLFEGEKTRLSSRVDPLSTMLTLVSRLSSQPRKPLRVAFVGAHGTGKTTLVKALSEHIKSLGIKCCVTPEVPRIVCEHAGDATFFRRGNNSLLKQTVLLVGQPVYEIDTPAGDE